MPLLYAYTIKSDFCGTTLSKNLETINQYFDSYKNRDNAFSPQ